MKKIVAVMHYGVWLLCSFVGWDQRRISGNAYILAFKK